MTCQISPRKAQVIAFKPPLWPFSTFPPFSPCDVMKISFLWAVLKQKLKFNKIP